MAAIRKAEFSLTPRANCGAWLRPGAAVVMVSFTLWTRNFRRPNSEYLRSMGEDFMFSATMKVRPFALCFLLAVTGLASAMGQGFQGVLTQHNDVGRTGQNLNETTLTPQNVSSGGFGKLFSYTVDGQIYAQPLYVPNVSIPGQGIHNVIYVATELDSVFAFDADGLTGTPLWQDSFIAMSQGIAPVPCWGSECGVYPYYGVTSTPVIDPSTNTMYLVSRSHQASTGLGFSYLHALDITTG